MKKRITRAVLTALCLAGIVLAGAENQDGSCNLVWTLSWLAVATLSGIGLKRTEDAR